MKTETATFKQLALVAGQLAARGATEYMAKHGALDPVALSAVLASKVKEHIGQALDDAKQALDVHMPKLAEANFVAVMVSAGIEAAKLVEEAERDAAKVACNHGVLLGLDCRKCAFKRELAAMGGGK